MSKMPPSLFKLALLKAKQKRQDQLITMGFRTALFTSALLLAFTVRLLSMCRYLSLYMVHLYALTYNVSFFSII